MIHKVLTVVWYARFFYIFPWMVFFFGSYDFILTKSGTNTQRMAMGTLHLNPPTPR